jgi:hypothetical protein
MVGVPAVTPDIIPVVGTTVASVVLLLDHVPPAVASESVDVWPVHTLAMPEIAAGDGLTRYDVVVTQPVGSI